MFTLCGLSLVGYVKGMILIFSFFKTMCWFQSTLYISCINLLLVNWGSYLIRIFNFNSLWPMNARCSLTSVKGLWDWIWIGSSALESVKRQRLSAIKVHWTAQKQCLLMQGSHRWKLFSKAYLAVIPLSCSETVLHELTSDISLGNEFNGYVTQQNMYIYFFYLL